MSVAEGERLAGFLMLGGEGLSAWTIRRRWGRLAELDIAALTPAEDQALELAVLVEAGELSYEEAEIRAGRFFFAQLEVDRAR